MTIARAGCVAFASAGVLLLLMGGQSRAPERPAPTWTFVIGGDTLGYLSPCGCTKPMAGGIRRRATMVRQFQRSGPTVVLENGGFVNDTSVQSRMKADAMGDAIASLRADAVHLTARETAFGPGDREALLSLVGPRWISATGEDLLAPRWRTKGPFLITAAKPTTDLAPAVSAAANQRRTLVVMLEGGIRAGQTLAQRFPAIRLIVAQGTGNIPAQPTKVGRTWIVDPGQQSRGMLALQWRGDQFVRYRAVTLGPDVPDDPAVASIYRLYQSRVANAGLLDALPRPLEGKFVGSAKCGECHQEDYESWRKSRHATAYPTLEKDGHDRDPDCVSCHVTGLEYAHGFRSRTQTPQLAEVGCESCHGPGADHSANPTAFPYAKIDEKSCLSCHKTSTSPNFTFLTYWPKIRHGVGITRGYLDGREVSKN